MSDRVRVFFQWLVDALMEGDLTWAEEAFVYPMSVFSRGEIRIEHTPEDTRAYILSRLKDVTDYGATYIHCEVREIVRKGNNRFSVLANFHFRNAKGEDLAKNESRFFCCDLDDGTIRIESIEFLSIGIPGTLEPSAPRH